MLSLHSSPMPRLPSSSGQLGGQGGKQIGQWLAVVPPAGHRFPVNGLTNLGDTRGPDRSSCLVVVQARRFPFQSAGCDQTPGDAFQVIDGFLVGDLVDRRRKNGPPVIHEPQVLGEPAGNMLGIVGPLDAAEIGHPARDGDVAQVAPAVDERGARKEDGQQAEVHVVVGHLVNDPSRRASQFAEPVFVPLNDLPQGRADLGIRQAREGMVADAIHLTRDHLEILAPQGLFTGTENL